MKQVLQDYKTGEVKVTDVPPPVVQRERVLVRAAASLISAGTERMSVDLGRKSLLGKARERPDLVKQVIQKVKNEGLLNTFKAIRSRLRALAALGYSTSGVVAGVGDGVTEFRVGDRVACAGAGFASHAELLSVPKNLCVRLPANLSFNAAAFGTLGAIALQGVRLAEMTLGESAVVIGLGLIGQLTVQLLKASGCHVFGIDLDPERIELARQLGADGGSTPDSDAKNLVMEWTYGRGADAVLITAATPSDQPVELAGDISRLRGRIVAVGLVGLKVPRKTFYERELTLRVSRSYGPGRYDPEYEERGHDYPLSFVRWTEGRNVEAFLDLVDEGRVQIDRLITHRFPIEEAEHAYELLTSAARERPLGVLLQYDSSRALERRIEIGDGGKTRKTTTARSVRVGLIGAGNYAKSILLPAFKAAGAEFQSIASASGVSAREVGETHRFRYCVSGADEVIGDPEVNLVVIATRHNLHAQLARRALEAGHHVFVEKPLALTSEALEGVLDAAARAAGQLMVGFNRRFSPLSRAAKDHFNNRSAPLSIAYRVNAGRIPRDNWIQDPHEGGGRVIGEVCHFIDLMHFLTGSLTTRVHAESISSRHSQIVDEDSVFITLRFADGSNGSVAYLAEGDRGMPKERLEIFGEGRTFVLDDFRSATAYERGDGATTRLRNQDKGQSDEARAVCAVVLEGKPAPIALQDLAATTRATFCIKESLRTGQAIDL